MNLHGLEIKIEYTKGEFKPSKNPAYPGDGWVMNASYGYFEETVSSEVGEQLDVFIGEVDNPNEVYLYLMQDPTKGGLEEIKVLMNFASAEEARDLVDIQYYHRDDCYLMVVPMKAFVEMVKSDKLRFMKEQAWVQQMEDLKILAKENEEDDDGIPIPTVEYEVVPSIMELY